MEQSKRNLMNSLVACVRDGRDPYKMKWDPVREKLSMAEFDQMVTDARKAYKKEEMIQNAIVGMLRQRLGEVGLPFFLERQKMRVKIYLKVEHVAIVMSVYHGRYASDVHKVIQTAQLLHDALSKIPIHFEMQGIKHWMHWEDSSKKD